jgi:hypothetical protein
VFAAFVETREAFPLPILGIDAGRPKATGPDLPPPLLRWSEQPKLTFTRSQAGTCTDGAHVQQKNWAVVGTPAGHQ